MRSSARERASQPFGLRSLSQHPEPCCRGQEAEGAEQHLEALALLVAADEDDGGGIRRPGVEAGQGTRLHSVRDDPDVRGDSPDARSRRDPSLLRHGEGRVEPARPHSDEMPVGAIGEIVAGTMERADDGRRSARRPPQATDRGRTARARGPRREQKRAVPTGFGTWSTATATPARGSVRRDRCARAHLHEDGTLECGGIKSSGDPGRLGRTNDRHLLAACPEGPGETEHLALDASGDRQAVWAHEGDPHSAARLPVGWRPAQVSRRRRFVRRCPRGTPRRRGPRCPPSGAAERRPRRR